MIALLLALLPVAGACEPAAAWVNGVLPEDGATLSPDAAVFLDILGYVEGGAFDGAELVVTRDGEEVAGSVQSWASVGDTWGVAPGFLVFRADAPFEVGATYQVSGRAAEGHEPTVTSFEVVDGAVATVDAAPVIAALSVGPMKRYDHGTCGAGSEREVEMVVEVALDDPTSKLHVFRLDAEDAAIPEAPDFVRAASIGPEEGEVTLSLVESDQPDLPHCFAVAQSDAAGRLSPFSGVACAEPRGSVGCATAPAGGAALLPLLALLGVRRRRT